MSLQEVQRLQNELRAIQAKLEAEAREKEALKKEVQRRTGEADVVRKRWEQETQQHEKATIDLKEKLAKAEEEAKLKALEFKKQLDSVQSLRTFDVSDFESAIDACKADKL